MANYPDYVIDTNSLKIDSLDGSISGRAESGDLRIQRLWGSRAEKFRIRFTHPVMTMSEYNELRAFYTNYNKKEITFTNPMSGESYTVFMMVPPTRKPINSWGTYPVDVRLEGVIDE